MLRRRSGAARKALGRPRARAATAVQPTATIRHGRLPAWQAGASGPRACFVTEVLLTFFFVFIIVGTTSKGAAVGFAGIPIGLALTLIHLISIPVTNTSVNPARSTGPALFAGGEYIGQLWLFWAAPLIGAAIGGALARWMYEPVAIIETEVIEARLAE